MIETVRTVFDKFNNDNTTNNHINDNNNNTTANDCANEIDPKVPWVKIKYQKLIRGLFFFH